MHLCLIPVFCSCILHRSKKKNCTLFSLSLLHRYWHVRYNYILEALFLFERNLNRLDLAIWYTQRSG